MSKYRIIITPSLLGKRISCALILASLVPVWLVKSDVYTALWFAQCLLSFSLVVFAWQQRRKPTTVEIVSVEDNGSWTELNGTLPKVWKVSKGSRVSRLMLWVELSPLIPMADNKSKWLWVFSDSVSTRDFRRLSRVIVRIQHSNEDEALRAW